MTQPMTSSDTPPDFEGRLLFGTFRAAQFLGLTLPTVKYHLYVATPPNLVPDAYIGEGGTCVFTRATLERFKLRKRGDPAPDLSDLHEALMQLCDPATIPSE